MFVFRYFKSYSTIAYIDGMEAETQTELFKSEVFFNNVGQRKLVKYPFAGGSTQQVLIFTQAILANPIYLTHNLKATNSDSSLNS